MKGKELVELKKKYDAVAYIPYKDEKIGNRKIYFRAPTVTEYVEYTIDDKIDTKHKCVQECVFTITDDRDESISEENIETTLLYIQEEASAFILQIYNNIIALSPLSNQEKTREIYLNAKEKQKLLISTVKLDLLLTFKDYKLIDDFDNFSFKKFIEYVVMLEEAKGTQGLLMSELLDDDSLLDPKVKEALDKINQANKKPEKKNKFPKNLNNIDPRSQDPALQSAITAAQTALQAKMAQDRAGVKSSVDFDSENSEHNKYYVNGQ